MDAANLQYKYSIEATSTWLSVIKKQIIEILTFYTICSKIEINSAYRLRVLLTTANETGNKIAVLIRWMSVFNMYRLKN